ncbi:MAG: 16S rRNA (cytosine(967)-C(5))-methyltransferase RsmB [Myxococcaceae bacterium]
MNARAVAISVLARTEATDAFMNLVLDAQLDEAGLKDPRDAGLVTELAYGATRRRLLLDSVIAKFADRGTDQMEDKVLAALRVGIYQLFFTRMPKHAAVGETVEALKELKLARASGFVNAILRKASALTEPPLPPKTELVAHLSLKESHPTLLVERWIRQFGAERAEQMLAADNVSPPVVIRTNSAKITRDELLKQLKEAGVEAEPTTISPVGITLPSLGKIEELYGYAEGLWQVQDEAAQLVGIYANIPETARVLDACAAPGGKANHLAENHEVVATDLHANKLRKIDTEAKRLGLSQKLTSKAHDATTEFPQEWGEFHAVVVDAPCSGSGTLRRHPELRYRRTDQDVLRLATLQRKILETAQAVVPPGGLLIYAVCSVDFREGPDQVELFLRSHPDWTMEPPVLHDDVKLPLWQGALRTLPGPEGLDGFFAARLRKLY